MQLCFFYSMRLTFWHNKGVEYLVIILQVSYSVELKLSIRFFSEKLKKEEENVENKCWIIHRLKSLCYAIHGKLFFYGAPFFLFIFLPL